VLGYNLLVDDVSLNVLGGGHGRLHHGAILAAGKTARQVCRGAKGGGCKHSLVGVQGWQKGGGGTKCVCGGGGCRGGEGVQAQSGWCAGLAKGGGGELTVWLARCVCGGGGRGVASTVWSLCRVGRRGADGSGGGDASTVMSARKVTRKKHCG
jgi:hypothetical protein